MSGYINFWCDHHPARLPLPLALPPISTNIVCVSLWLLCGGGNVCVSPFSLCVCASEFFFPQNNKISLSLYPSPLSLYKPPL